MRWLDCLTGVLSLLSLSRAVDTATHITPLSPMPPLQVSEALYLQTLTPAYAAVQPMEVTVPSSV